MTSHTNTPLRPDIEARIFRKTLIKIFPVLMLGMFISYMDRANLGVLAAPLRKDLGLDAATFGLAAGLFYVGYLVFEIPSNMALAKFGARKWIARIMITWGAATMLMAFIQNDIQLFIMRILLGVAEAGFSPGVYLFLAFWCTPRMLTRSYSIFNLAVPISLAIASVLTSSLLLLDGTFGFAGWRWTFFLQGIPAILLAVYIFFKLPDRPGDADWLDESEKAYLADVGTQADNASAHELKQLPAVLRRLSAWVFSLTYFCFTISFWAITYFLPSIVKEQFKMSTVAAGFTSAIPWLFSAVVMLVISKSVTKTGDRKWHMTMVLLAGAVGLAIGATSANPFIAIAGVSIAAAGFFGALSAFWTMPAQVFAGGLSAVAIAMVNSFGNLSGLLGPWILGSLKDTTGSTSAGLLIMSGFLVAAAVLAFVMSTWSDKVTGGLSPGADPHATNPSGQADHI